MNLQDLIKGINTTEVAPPNGASTTKVASSPNEGGDKSAIDAAVNSALQALSTPKTAAADKPAGSDPVNDLKKIAEGQVELNKEAELQQAYMVGMAMADGFVQGLNQHKEAAEKVAGEQNHGTQALNTLPDGVTVEDLQLIKIAKENPGEFLELVQQGYNNQMEAVKQSSEQVYDETYNQVVQGIHKLATDHYLAGYGTTQELVKELAAGA